MENKNRFKIGFVVQRYGLEVNGGAELYARQVSEMLSKKYNVEVITTCAIDYVTWKNEYDCGRSQINGVDVLRFKVDKQRDLNLFNKFSEKVLGNSKHNYFDEIEWMKMQGPYSSELINYLITNKKKYNAIFFMTYLYFTTYFGIHIAPEKSILIPTAHDEPPIYLNIFNSVFNLPRVILYNTIEEKEFVNKKFRNEYIPSKIVGIGVRVPEQISAQYFLDKYKLGNNFILYIGRIEKSKGCDELFDYFLKYKKRNNSNVKLVLIGKSVMDIPENEDILKLGFVSDKDKFSAIAACKLLVLPSYFESLSMVVLESMKLKKPVLLNGKCEVLKGHCLRSNAGLYYTNYNEFEACLNLLLNNDHLRESMGMNGVNYVSKNYRWDVIEKKFDDAIKKIVSN